MSQTAIVGVNGSITLPDSMTQWVGSFTFTTGQALLNVSHYGGGGWEQFVAGLKGCSGSAVAIMTKGAAGTNPLSFTGTGGSLTLTFDTGCTVTFAAIIGTVNIVGEYAGLNVISFTWAHSDVSAPVVAWQTS